VILSLRRTKEPSAILPRVYSRSVMPCRRKSVPPLGLEPRTR
jgi:hypothetical protein